MATTETSRTARVTRGRLGKLLIASTVVAATVLLAAGPASAHIVVTVPGGTTEGLGNLTFQVHNESESATAVKVTVDLPLAAPFGEVNPFHIANWTITKTITKLPAPVKSGDFTLTKAVSSVTWTAAAGTGIPPGQIQLLTLNAGPYPTKGTLGFPTTVTLSDGSTVHWNQATPANGQEPDFPTPELQLSSVVANDAPVATPSPSATPAATASSTSAIRSNVALGLGAVGLVIAVIALVVALGSRRKQDA